MNEETPEEVIEETVVETPEVTTEEPSSPEEEPQIEKPRIYAGKYNSPEELEKAYQEANTANTKMAQELALAKKPVLTPDKQSIHDEIKALGFVSQDEIAKQNAVQIQKAKDEAEISKLNLNESQANMVRNLAKTHDNLAKPITQIWDELQGAIGGKVVSRKTTIKPKVGTKTSSFKVLSPDEASKLPREEYDKYWKDYAAHIAEQ